MPQDQPANVETTEVELLINSHNKKELAEMVVKEKELKKQAHGKNREMGKENKELQTLVEEQEKVLQNNERYVHTLNQQLDYKDFLLNQSEQKQKAIVEEISRTLSTLENVITTSRKAISHEISRPFERYIGAPTEETNE